MTYKITVSDLSTDGGTIIQDIYLPYNAGDTVYLDEYSSESDVKPKSGQIVEIKITNNGVLIKILTEENKYGLYHPQNVYSNEEQATFAIRNHKTLCSSEPRPHDEYTCPVCGNEELDYTSTDNYDTGAYRKWICPTCGATGKGYCEKTFVTHTNMRAANGEPLNCEMPSYGVIKSRINKSRQTASKKYKKWRHDDNNHISLYFTPYYDEEKLATIEIDEYGYWLTSEMMRIDRNPMADSSIDDAKEYVEDLIAEHYRNEIAHYNHLFKSFILPAKITNYVKGD